VSISPTLAPVSDLGPIRISILLSSPSATLPRPNQLKKQQKATTAMVAPSSPLSCSEFVKDGCLLTFLSKGSVASASRFPGIPPELVLLELLLLLVNGRLESEGILVYLAAAEDREPDVWLKDDYRIAWLTVLYSANGRATPWEWAFNQVIGGHPSKVIPQLVARDRKHLALELPPKKSVSSVAAKTISVKESTR
jgi:hypothetical protein